MSHFEQGLEPSDLRAGLPFWLVRNGLNGSYGAVDADLSTDVIVIGAGITGALCAYYLSRAGTNVIVVDAGSVGAGSTCASTALLQYEIDVPLRELMKMTGEDRAVRAYQASARAVRDLLDLAAEIGSPDVRPRNSVQFASKRSHVKGLRQEAELRRKHGLPAEIIEEEQVRTALLFPAPLALRSELAAEMDAWRFTHALHARSVQLGARVFSHSSVQRVMESGDKVEVVLESGSRITARHVIHATGYAAQPLLPKGALRLHSTYALATEPMDPRRFWPGRALIWETARPYMYMRTTPDNRIILGGRDEAFRNPALRDGLLRSKAEALMRDLRERSPQFDVRAEFVWCGTFGETKDGLPIIDRVPGHARSHLALGMGGNGITFSVIAAGILCDVVHGKVHPDASLFALDR